MGLEICRVDHHGLLFAVLSGQTCHHPGEDAFLAPPLPPAVERSLIAASSSVGLCPSGVMVLSEVALSAS